MQADSLRSSPPRPPPQTGPKRHPSHAEGLTPPATGIPPPLAQRMCHSQLAYCPRLPNRPSSENQEGHDSPPRRFGTEEVPSAARPRGPRSYIAFPRSSPNPTQRKVAWHATMKPFTQLFRRPNVCRPHHRAPRPPHGPLRRRERPPAARRASSPATPGHLHHPHSPFAVRVREDAPPPPPGNPGAPCAPTRPLRPPQSNPRNPLPSTRTLHAAHAASLALRAPEPHDTPTVLLLRRRVHPGDRGSATTTGGNDVPAASPRPLRRPLPHLPRRAPQPPPETAPENPPPPPSLQDDLPPGPRPLPQPSTQPYEDHLPASRPHQTVQRRRLPARLLAPIERREMGPAPAPASSSPPTATPHNNARHRERQAGRGRGYLDGPQAPAPSSVPPR